MTVFGLSTFFHFRFLRSVDGFGEAWAKHVYSHLLTRLRQNRSRLSKWTFSYTHFLGLYSQVSSYWWQIAATVVLAVHDVYPVHECLVDLGQTQITAFLVQVLASLTCCRFQSSICCALPMSAIALPISLPLALNRVALIVLHVVAIAMSICSSDKMSLWQGWPTCSTPVPIFHVENLEHATPLNVSVIATIAK